VAHTFVPIAVGPPKVVGVDGGAAGLLIVDVELTPPPPREWLQIFVAGPSGLMWPASWHPPSVRASLVTMRASDEEVEMYVGALQQRVDATNIQYEREVVPRLQLERERAEHAAGEQARRIRDAQARLDERGTSR
jgi:hypothetical protein